MGSKGWATEGADINWDGVSTAAPPPLPEGLYFVRVVKAEAIPTSKGEPSVKVELQAHTLYGGDKLEKPRKLFDNFTFGEAIFRLKQLCVAAAVDPPKNVSYGVVDEFCGNLLNSEVIVKVKHEEFPKGQTPPKINARVNGYYNEEQAASAAAGGKGEPQEEKATRRKRA